MLNIAFDEKLSRSIKTDLSKLLLLKRPESKI